MKLSEFKLNIPRASIADTPADPRSESKMMVVNPKTGAIDDRTVKDLVKIAKRGDCIVLNETKVFPASFHGIKEKTNANIDVMLLRELNKPDNIWDVLVEPARKVRIGNKIYFDDGRFYCEIIDNTTARGRTVRFSYQGDLFDEIKRIGDMALPEYVRREIEFEDKARYQTEYANENFLSSIAPPSAGLFVTQDMIEKLEAKGVRIAKVTTNLGLEIFETIEVEDISKYRMYSEYFEISPEAAETINKAIKSKKEIIAIGSSTVRALESSVLTTSIVKANKGWTDRYIYPNYDFRIPTKLLTTFHPMFTTSVLLSIAFCNNDKDLLMKAYRSALKNDYKYHVYGDALLINGSRK